MISEQQIIEIFETHRDGLVRFASRRVGCAQTAADIVQHTFQKILERKDTTDDVRLLHSYFYQAVNHQCINYFQARDIARSYRPALEYADIQRLTEGFPGPEEVVAKQQFLDLLQAQVNVLAPKSRMAFTLVEIQHYSVREAAEHMGLTEMAVYQLVNRAYATLAKRMMPALLQHRTR